MWIKKHTFAGWYIASSKEDMTWYDDVPQYLKDLNDMHQVLKNARFTQQQWSRYCDLLLEIAGKNLGGAFEATAELY